MIKKCKITNIINPPIFGVVEKPIREGNIVDLNVGQIAVCLGAANVDEILPSGAVVRLNRDNYQKDNSGNTAKLTLKDAIADAIGEVDTTPVVEEAPVETVTEEVVSVEPTPVVEEKTEDLTETKVDEEPTPVVEDAPVETVTEEVVSVDEKSVETTNEKEDTRKNKKSKK